MDSSLELEEGKSLHSNNEEISSIKGERVVSSWGIQPSLAKPVQYSGYAWDDSSGAPRYLEKKNSFCQGRLKIRLPLNNSESFIEDTLECLAYSFGFNDGNAKEINVGTKAEQKKKTIKVTFFLFTFSFLKFLSKLVPLILNEYL